MKITRKTGKEKGFTEKECCEIMSKKVAHYKVAGRDIYSHGIYRRGRKHCRPLEGSAGHVDIYYMNEEGNIVTLCYNTTRHRASVLLRSLTDGTLSNVDDEIIMNYATNGHSTRRGLFRSGAYRERIRAIAQSHADYMGSETGNSTHDHSQRVAMRN